MQQKAKSENGLYKFFIYFVLFVLAVTIVVPVAWVFMASIKENREFYGNPWTLPEGIYWQNFVDAWNKASMGEYMINSVIVTALSIILLLVIAFLLQPSFLLVLYHAEYYNHFFCPKDMRYFLFSSGEGAFQVPEKYIFCEFQKAE